MQNKIYIGVALAVLGAVAWFSLYRYYEGPRSIATLSPEGEVPSNFELPTEKELEEWNKETEEWYKANSKPYTFRSENLGISFSYLSPYGYSVGSIGKHEMDSYNIIVKEEGNKIFIDRDGLPLDDYPKIEVFEKDSNITLYTAVVQKFDYIDAERCYLRAAGGKGAFYGDEYSDALYNSFLRRDKSLYPEGLYIVLTCNEKGSEMYSEGYHFEMNADIPNKFIKVHDGQYIMTLDATGEHAWQYSIKIFK